MRIGRVSPGVALAVLLAFAQQALAQGIIPGKPVEGEETPPAEISGLGTIQNQQVGTIQRLLKRLGYLGDSQMTRTMDSTTVAAIQAHLRDSGLAGGELTPDLVIRSLFQSAWVKEGWASGSVKGQDIVVEKEQVRQAQEALKLLNGSPGPTDGVFGPATLSAIEVFQEDSGLKVTGLLTRDTLHNILRATKFIGNPPASTVYMLNWPDNIDPAALDSFERETNIRVVQDTYDDSSETKKLLLAGSSKYDVIIQHGAQMRQILEKKDAVETIDRVKIPNILGVDTASKVYVERLDPGNLHSMPYMWGTIGLGINQDKVQALLPDAPLDSMALLLEPEKAAILSQCGIAVIDEPAGIIPSIVSYLGGNYNDFGITDLESVDVALQKIAPYVDVIPAERFIDTLAKGKYCVTFGQSGDILFAREPAKARGTGDIVYYVPKEGSQIWFDLLLIPGNSKNKEAAYQLINHLLKPEVAAATTNYLRYANSVWGSAPFIDKTILDDSSIYPSRETLRRLSIQPPLTADVEAAMDSIWDKFKAN